MIQVESLRFRYPNNPAQTLQGLSFEVHLGEVFGFLGPSGAGKSTTQNILTKLLGGWSGKISIMGRPLAEWKQDYYNHVGVSFELPNHYSKLSARENLNYFRSLYDVETLAPKEVMQRVGLENHLDRIVSDFSKGMKNRLNLARSLLHQPKLWFLDEPTSGLDPVSAQRVRELVVQRRTQGVTTVLTTHDMVTAETLCDRVAFILDGKIAEIGAPADLRQKYGKREVELRYGSVEAPCTQRFPLDGLGENPGFLQLLSRESVHAIHSQECSLAEVFVRVTGRKLK